MSSEFRGIFRREAIDHHLTGVPSKGDLLRLSPEWMRWTYPMVLAVVVAGLLFMTIGRIHIYATGPAVVRMSGRTDIASSVSAIVKEVAVVPGQGVKAGDLLIRLESTEQSAELERVTREFEDQLANHLRDPLDDASRRNVASLRAQKDFAERILEIRLLRAPQDGVVEDIRVRIGQPLAPGQIAATVSSGAPMLQLVAALPGQYRPQLDLGLPAWLELQGYSHAHQKILLESIGSEVTGPAEARRFLGAEVADAIPLAGPVVMVQGKLPRRVFRAAGANYVYHDGMQGQLEVRVHSEPILFSLVPGLRSFTESRRD